MCFSLPVQFLVEHTAYTIQYSLFTIKTYVAKRLFPMELVGREEKTFYTQLNVKTIKTSKFVGKKNGFMPMVKEKVYHF